MMSKSLNHPSLTVPARPFPAWLFLAIAILLAGCSEQPVPPLQFEPNLVHAMKHQIKEDVPTEQASKDAMVIVTEMFGTPDAPKRPVSRDGEMAEDLDDAIAELISIENLEIAAGPFHDGKGLYRKHCAQCHGVTGNGRGPASIINPYPRDYRMGVFKFKSTKRPAKPTREDLVHVIANGIVGTPMNKIPELTDDDVQALADYVMYLSIRGELERTLIDTAIFELDLESGDRVLDYQLGNWIEQLSAKRNPSGENPKDVSEPDYEADQLIVGGQKIKEKLFKNFRKFKKMATLRKSGQSLQEELADLEKWVQAYTKLSKPLNIVADESDEEPEELEFADHAENLFDNYEMYLDSWVLAEELAADIVAEWLDAEDKVIEVPDPPADLPIAESYDQYTALAQGEQADALAASVQRGQELFVGKVASCGKCHGEKGLGNGTTNDYDDWTKDWTTRAGLKPEDKEKLIPLLARGALPPRNALPRNFATGIFRGGGDSKSLYRRIVAGIAGTPMPAATFVDGQFEQDDVWHIINFVRSLQEAPLSSESPTQSPSAVPGDQPSTEPTIQQTAAR